MRVDFLIFRKLITLRWFLTSFLIFLSLHSFSQVVKPTPNWDNQGYIGNKVAANAGDWRFSGELQVRLKDDLQSLDNWFMEGVATYMLSDKWEIVPDFRMSIKPEEVEYRPGFGVIYKFIKSDFQLVNQLKWQVDLDNRDNVENGVRYAIFINRKLTEKLVSNFAFGAFFRFSEGFNEFEFIRFGPGLAYVINAQHTININYLLSAKNNRQYWEWAGIPVVQLVININKGYKYVPAKYFSF